MSSIAAIDRNAWRALFAAQLGWMLDAMDFLLFTFAIVPIQKEFALSSATMGGLTSVALVASAIGELASALAAPRLACSGRTGNGRRVVVRIGPGRGDVARRAPREGDGHHAVRLGDRRAHRRRRLRSHPRHLRLARLVSDRRAPGGGGVLYPPHCRRAAALARSQP